MSKRYPGGIIRKTPQTPSQTSAQGIWDMASVTQAVKENTWPIAGVPDPISKSLRFRSSASAYLNRTGSTVTNAKLATYSFWMKRGILTTGQWLFTGGTTTTLIGFNGSSDSLSVLGSDSSGEGNITTAVFRDPSAWYHVVIAIDTSQATTADRAKIYVNGVQQAVSVSNGGITLNSNWGFNTAGSLAIGRYSPVPGSYFDGYLAEVYFIGGQALTPSSFGNTNDQTGVWQPIAYTGTYGTNGFYLPFSNTASTTTLGYDFSGNSNNWTTNNISLTSGSTYDSMNDVPTQWIPYNTAGDTGALWRGNYAVWNSLPAVGSTSKPTYSQGNLTVAFPSFGYAGPLSTLSLPTQNTYCEITCASVGGGGYSGVGIAELFADLSGNVVPTKCVTYGPNGGKTVSGAFSSYGSSFTTGDIIGIAYDYSGNQVTFYKNNVSQGALSLSSLSGALFFCCHATSGAITWTANFGQRPFSYTPPSGFKTLNTTNLPTPTIGATASTQADDYFNAVLYSGNNSTQNIAVGFQPDWVWSKCRNVGRSHRLSDAVRGSTRDLYSNTTDAEQNDGSITSFISTGFSLNNATGSAYNTSGETYVSWAWKANGAGSSNTAGSITSTVSANTTAGFSVVTYTGTGSAATIGHGLGVAPSMMIVKRRNGAANWFVYHSVLGATQYIYLDATAAAITASGAWNNTAPTSTVFSVGNFGEVNLNTGTYVAYCFAPVAGYSAFGSYTGNGSTDGPFIFTGFRPRYFILKNITNAQSWSVQDTSRSPYNVGSAVLIPNSSSAELTGTDFIDIVSNGFKIRHSSSGNNNNSGSTYIYMAFAESPFKYSLAR